MNKATRTTLMAVAAAACITPAFAQGPGGKGPRGGFFGGHGDGPRFGDGPTTKIVEMMDKRLDLTDEQQAKIEAIVTASRDKIQPLAKQIREESEKSREEIKAVLTEEQRAKIADAKEDFGAAVCGFAAAHKDQIRERVEGMGEEMRLRVAMQKLDLTAEQRTKLQEIGKTMREDQQEIHDAVRPKMEELRKQAKEQLNAVLTEEQRTKLEEKLKDMPKMTDAKGPGRFGDRMRRPDAPGRPDRPGRRGPNRPDGPPQGADKPAPNDL